MIMLEPQSEMIKLGDDEFCLHSWNNNKTDASAQQSPTDTTGVVAVLIYHGMGTHGLYPTVRYAAEALAFADPLVSSTATSSSSLLSSSGGEGGGEREAKAWMVMAPDMRGHGRSPGLQGYLPSADIVVDDAYRVAEYVTEKFHPRKLFLVGTSMGGAIALQVAQRLSPDKVTGVILLAPMLKLNVSSLEQSLLSGIATVLSTWRLIPSSATDSSKQYRDEKKREECMNDPLISQSSMIRVGTAHTCVDMASRLDFTKVQVPFWLGVADEDVVVNNQGSFDLYEQAISSDKTMKRYAALHGIMCEPDPLFNEIASDILNWIRERL